MDAVEENLPAVSVAEETAVTTVASSESVADKFGTAFGFEKKVGNSSVFASTFVECMKSPFKGDMGHIAVRTPQRWLRRRRN